MRLLNLFLFAVFFAPGLASVSRAAPAERPNVLWITSEDNSKHFVRLFDPAGAAMPNLEQLAANGIVFDRAFSNAPVCSTARSTIISGCYGPRVLAQFHRRSALAPMPDGLHMFPWYLRQAGYYTTNNSKTDYNLEDKNEPWDESSSTASWRNRKPGQPFFHVQNHGVTHESSLHFSAAEMASTRNETPNDSVTLFPEHPDTPIFRYTYARYHDRHKELDGQIGELLAMLQADGLAEDTIVFYYGDHGGVLPGSKGYTHETGLHVPMVVHFPKKWQHLAPLPAGSRTNGFVSFVDLAPTVLHLAGLHVPEQMDGRPFLGEGIDPGELALRNETYAYADRFDEKYDFVRTVRKGRFKYIRNYQPFNFDGLQNNYRYKMLAYQEWRDLYHTGKLNTVQSRFFKPRAAEELYDLETDPYELHNLANDLTFAATRDQMRGRLNKWVRGMPDLSFLPENVLMSDALENPVRFGQKHRGTIARLLEIADLSLVPFSEAEPKLSEIIQNGEAGERYWALIACSAHGDAAKPLLPLAEQLSAEDPERLVRVRAAEFLALVGGVDVRSIVIEALKNAGDPVEANLIANTVVLLQDGAPGLDFDIDPTWFPDAWRANPRNEFTRRLEYLSDGYTAPSK